MLRCVRQLQSNTRRAYIFIFTQTVHNISVAYLSVVHPCHLSRYISYYWWPRVVFRHSPRRLDLRLNLVHYHLHKNNYLPLKEYLNHKKSIFVWFIYNIMFDSFKSPARYDKKLNFTFMISDNIPTMI